MFENEFREGIMADIGRPRHNNKATTWRETSIEVFENPDAVALGDVMHSFLQKDPVV